MLVFDALVFDEFSPALPFGNGGASVPSQSSFGFSIQPLINKTNKNKIIKAIISFCI